MGTSSTWNGPRLGGVLTMGPPLNGAEGAYTNNRHSIKYSLLKPHEFKVNWLNIIFITLLYPLWPWKLRHHHGIYFYKYLMATDSKVGVPVTAKCTVHAWVMEKHGNMKKHRNRIRWFKKNVDNIWIICLGRNLQENVKKSNITI